MIGGVVIEVIQLPDKTWINCEETDSTLKCAIYVERSRRSETIRMGDSLWWQSRNAYWTPYEYRQRRRRGESQGKAGVDYDLRLRRIGYSGVKRPEKGTQ